MIDYRENNKWKVYVHIVPKEISGHEWDKYYVGITSRKPEVRWQNGNGYSKQQLFYRAIQKYGWENIEHQIISEHLTKTEALDFEKMLIKTLKSNDRKYGYNITSGGEGSSGYIKSQETIEKIKKANIGRKQPKDAIEKMRQKRLGMKLSEDTLKKRSEYFKNTPPEEIGITKTIYQFSKEGKFIEKFYSIKSASEKTGINRSKISKASVHNNCSAGGFLWISEDNVIQECGEYKIKNFIYNKSNTSGGNREVYQFDKHTNSFIEKYCTVAEASRKTGDSAVLIRDDARCKRTNISNKKIFRWRYKEDVIESEDNSDSFIMLR